MRINSIQSYNNYNNRISYKSVVTGNKCAATKVADSISFKGRDPFEALKEYFAENFLDQDKVNKLTPESSLQYDLDLDSIDFLQFRMDIEAIVGEEISDKEFAKILTLKDVTNFMTDHREAFSSEKKTVSELYNLGYSELLCF